MSGGAHDAATASLAGLYREAIRRHAANPVGYRRPIAATHRHETYNPLCGDRIEVSLRLAGDEVAEVAFDGEACAICMASASLLCGLAPGRTVAGLRQLNECLQEALNAPQGPPAGVPAELQPLLGVRPYPSRIRCATLPWVTAVSAMANGCASSPD